MHELYIISGRVMQGDKRGKALGFPTANIALHKKVPEGIYAARVSINGKPYDAATFVGSAETFQQTKVKVESYLFDFNQDIYGKWITVKLYKKIRKNIKFEAVEDLVEQMKMDVEEVKEYFSKKG